MQAGCSLAQQTLSLKQLTIADSIISLTLTVYSEEE